MAAVNGPVALRLIPSRLVLQLSVEVDITLMAVTFPVPIVFRS